MWLVAAGGGAVHREGHQDGAAGLHDQHAGELVSMYIQTASSRPLLPFSCGCHPHKGPSKLEKEGEPNRATSPKCGPLIFRGSLKALTPTCSRETDLRLDYPIPPSVPLLQVCQLCFGAVGGGVRDGAC